MYGFKATYENKKTLEERNVLIEINEQYHESEEEIFISAITLSLKEKRVSECFCSLEFLYC
jgi:hypothetical protein